MQRRPNTEVVRDLFEGLQSVLDGADPETAFASAAPDFEWFPAEEVPGRSTHVGTKEFLEFMQAWTEDFETWTFELDRLVEAPDGRVVGLANQVGVGKSSGARVELYFGVVFEVEDGLVVRARAFLDPNDALRYAGAGG